MFSLFLGEQDKDDDEEKSESGESNGSDSEQTQTDGEMTKEFDQAARTGKLEADVQMLQENFKAAEKDNDTFRKSTTKALGDIAAQLSKLTNPTGTKPKTQAGVDPAGAAAAAAAGAGAATAPKTRSHSFRGEQFARVERLIVNKGVP